MLGMAGIFALYYILHYDFQGKCAICVIALFHIPILAGNKAMIFFTSLSLIAVGTVITKSQVYVQ